MSLLAAIAAIVLAFIVGANLGMWWIRRTLEPALREATETLAAATTALNALKARRGNGAR